MGENNAYNNYPPQKLHINSWLMRSCACQKNVWCPNRQRRRSRGFTREQVRFLQACANQTESIWWHCDILLHCGIRNKCDGSRSTVGFTPTSSSRIRGIISSLLISSRSAPDSVNYLCHGCQPVHRGGYAVRVIWIRLILHVAALD
jgi:hypothetical protein